MAAVTYQLIARVDYMRRESMSSLLFSLAHKALRDEGKGEAWEQAHCHLTGDGDYSGVSIVDVGSSTEGGELDGSSA